MVGVNELGSILRYLPRLLNQNGQIMRTHRPETTAEGLNTFLLNLSAALESFHLIPEADQRKSLNCVSGSNTSPNRPGRGLVGSTISAFFE